MHELVKPHRAITPKEFRKYPLCGGFGGGLNIRANLSPMEYLEFAKADVGGQSARSRINSVSNAKRAMHYQVELISSALGFDAFKNKGNRFAHRLKYCSQCGVIGERIVRKLNSIRNEVEHRYFLPTQDKAEDYVDTVELFIHSTNRFVNFFPEFVDINSEDLFTADRSTISISATMDPGAGKIQVSGYRFDGDHGKTRSLVMSHVEELGMHQSDIRIIQPGNPVFEKYIKQGFVSIEITVVPQDDDWYDWVNIMTSAAS